MPDTNAELEFELVPANVADRFEQDMELPSGKEAGAELGPEKLPEPKLEQAAVVAAAAAAAAAISVSSMVFAVFFGFPSSHWLTCAANRSEQ